MPLLPYALARPLLFGLDAEHAHELTLDTIARLQNTPAQCAWQALRVDDPVTIAGLRFPNRVGLAAGLDKNGRCIDGLGAMGFGFIEIGTVTPRPQQGNPRPRMFRLPEAHAVINRLGFNNDGLEKFVANVRRARRFRQGGGILGLNIGKNATTPIERAVDDYLECLEGVYPHADYVAVNVSSPNTENLRSLQTEDALNGLLAALQERRHDLERRHSRKVPLFVKIAPDLDAQQLASIAASLRQHGVDGVIATNTTTQRDAVRHLPNSDQPGGLSGMPVLAASNQVVVQLRQALGRDFPIIGVGGITTADAAVSKMAAGANAVQLYTGLIYQGPRLVSQVARALRA